MKIGDLIRDKTYGDIGLIVEILDVPARHRQPSDSPYCVLYEGKLVWHSNNYIDYECEVISESR
jgi:hypothetical protein